MVTFQEMAEFMDPVEPPNTLRELYNMHRWARSEEWISLRAIARRHTSPYREVQRFMFLNTWLMDVSADDPGWGAVLGGLLGGPVGAAGAAAAGDFTGGSKPAVDARAREIGEFIYDTVDIACLAEVWEEEEKDTIVSQWPSDRRPFHKEGDIGRFAKNSDGLLVISRELPIVRDKERHEFTFASGHDAKADKAVIQVRVDVGIEPSLLELYVTHFQAGDRMIQLTQAIETAWFISRTHDPANPAILVGDFNIKAHDERETIDSAELVETYKSMIRRRVPAVHVGELSGDFRRFLDRTLADEPRSLTDYEVLVELLAEVGFNDLWEARNGTSGYTSHMDNSWVAEQICPPHEDGPNLDSHPRIKFCKDISVPADEKRSDEQGSSPPLKFREDDEPKWSDRIDHIFVSQSSEDQSFTVDFTRPRRLRLERDPDAPKFDKIAFMSDHIALETILLITPRR